MNRLTFCAILFALSVNVLYAQTQNSPSAPAGKKKTATSLKETLLKFLGISANPSTFKGPGDEVVNGYVWVVDLESKRTRPLTSTGGYRSPIFMSADEILVLRGTDVIRISTAAGKEKKLYSVDGITKLVGCSSEDPNKVVVLLRSGARGRPRVRLLTITTGITEAVPYDSSSSQDLQMVESLEGWTRTYGNWELYVESQSKQSLSGTVEWTDVFLRVGNGKPDDISRCDGSNCGQPSLSNDKHLAVFVKSGVE